MICTVTYATVGAGMLASNIGVPVANVSPVAESLTAQVKNLQSSPVALASARAPKLVEPTWLKEQNASEQAAKQQQTSRNVTVTYTVETRGSIAANVDEFRAQALATLNDARGWSRMGVSFQEVASGGMFTLVLSEASQMTSFSPTGCGAEYSCRVGQYVIINQDRWLGATPSWNAAEGSLRDYRHMVVNHETGHWLGHGHATECGPNQLARVMQQQSIDLRGCGFNPWPVDDELWSSQLGIE